MTRRLPAKHVCPLKEQFSLGAIASLETMSTQTPGEREFFKGGTSI